jgi:thioredoxin-dependent peroxiredoxin
MTIFLGDKVPDFEANTSTGKISFHEYLGDSWGCFFSHPGFTNYFSKLLQLTSLQFVQQNLEQLQKSTTNSKKETSNQLLSP